MPSTNLVEACSSYLIVLVFFRVCIYQKCRNHKTKYELALGGSFQTFLLIPQNKTKQTPTPITIPTKHHSQEAITKEKRISLLYKYQQRQTQARKKIKKRRMIKVMVFL
jgi:hypothetical protein